MSTPLPNPRVGVAAVVLGPDGRVIFGRRKGSHGAGMFPLLTYHFYITVF